MKFSYLFKAVFFQQLAIVLITIAALIIIPERGTYLGGTSQAYVAKPLIYSRANFDGNHYLDIAVKGYGYSQQAFFPLYPKLITFFSPIFRSPVGIGIAISLLSFIIGLYLLTKLLALDYSQPVIKYSVLALLFFPVSFYFSFVYTEGLFFLLIVSSFYFARKNHWLLAALTGFLAAYTRLAGIFIFPALLIELWQSHRFTPVKLIYLCLIPFGLGLFMLFLDQSTGDPLAFIHVQSLFRQGRSEDVVLIYQVFWRYLKMLFTVNRADPLFMTIVLEAGVGIVFFFTSLISLVRHRLSYAVFGLLSYLLPTLTGTFTSLPRYVLICFPSFIILGEAFSKSSPVFKRLFLLGSSVLFIIYTSLFIRGYWVS